MRKSKSGMSGWGSSGRQRDEKELSGAKIVGMWEKQEFTKTGGLRGHTKAKAQATMGMPDNHARELCSPTLQHFSRMCLISTPPPLYPESCSSGRG